MAKKKAPSKRAQERAELQELYGKANYSGLQNLFDMGKLNISDIRKYYTDARSKAQKRVQRIETSDVPFTDRAPVFFPTSAFGKNVKSMSEQDKLDLFKAVHEVNKFLNRPTTLEERRGAYNELLDDLHSKGLDFLDMSNLKDWDRFRKWLKAKGILNQPYVTGSVISEIFKAGVQEGKSNSEFWQAEYEKFKSLLGQRKGANRVKAPRAKRRGK